MAIRTRPEISLVIRRGGAYSIERAFLALASEFDVSEGLRVYRPARESRGMLDRLLLMREVRKNSGEVTHITGDIHYASLLLRRARTVLTMHDFRLWNAYKFPLNWVYRLIWYYLPSLWVGHITVGSSVTRDELVALMPWTAKKVSVIYHPLTVEVAITPRVNKGRTRFLQVGTAEYKNLKNVALALSSLNDSIDLRIVGRLTELQRKFLESLNLEYSNVFDISDDDMRQEYVNSDVVCFVSMYEGFGLPIVEAQACGRPVICSDREPMSEVAGSGALLVDPESVEDIRAAAVELMNNPDVYSELVKFGESNLERFNPARIASEYRRLYQSARTS